MTLNVIRGRLIRFESYVIREECLRMRKFIRLLSSLVVHQISFSLLVVFSRVDVHKKEMAIT